MPYPIIKEEHYTNPTGMNAKVNSYSMPEGSCPLLINFGLVSTGSLTKVPGSTPYCAASVSGRITGLAQFSQLTGQSYIIASANTNIYSVVTSPGPTFQPIWTGVQNNALFDFAPFVNRLFCGNGNDFVKTDGQNTYLFSLPPGASGFVLAAGASGTGSFTGYFQYSYGYLNERGYLGPAVNFAGISIAASSGVTIGGLTTPLFYGITQLIIYRSLNAQTDALYQIGSINPNTTSFFDTGFTASTQINPTYVWFTLAPRFMEVFNNQLFMAGFSSTPSTVWFSDIDEPEGVGATASFEVRTNDSDRITALTSYGAQLTIFKQRLFFSLYGDNPQNFTLQQQSDQYGCVSNRATAVFNSILLFLDRKGIAQYNGAQVNIISMEMDPIFLRMNLEAALDNACMLHVKERNEIWCMFPIDGSTINNQMVVYDYSTKGWYLRSGLQFQSLALVIDPVTDDTLHPIPFYGSYSGTIHYFSTMLFGDNGNGMTCLWTTRFHQAGNSNEEVWRRLWLDVTPQDPSIGGTVAVNINMFVDRGMTTPYFSNQVYGSTWQTRVDFGIPAKSIAFEFSHFSDSQPLQINGYALGHRFQRDR